MYIELAHAKKKRGGGKKRGKRRRGGEEREEEGEEKEERKNARAQKKKESARSLFFAREPSTSGRISGGPKISGKGPRRQGGPFLGGTFFISNFSSVIGPSTDPRPSQHLMHIYIVIHIYIVSKVTYSLVSRCWNDMQCHITIY